MNYSGAALVVQLVYEPLRQPLECQTSVILFAESVVDLDCSAHGILVRNVKDRCKHERKLKVNIYGYFRLLAMTISTGLAEYLPFYVQIWQQIESIFLAISQLNRWFAIISPGTLWRLVWQQLLLSLNHQPTLPSLFMLIGSFAEPLPCLSEFQLCAWRGTICGST